MAPQLRKENCKQSITVYDVNMNNTELKNIYVNVFSKILGKNEK